jgi:hypothetical protein
MRFYYLSAYILPAWYWFGFAAGLTFLVSWFFQPLRAWRRDLLWLSVVALATGTVCYSVMYFSLQ